MRIWTGFLLVLALGLLAACAPQVRADPGEVVYDVPVSSQLGSLQAVAAGNPVVIRLQQELAVYYQIEARAPSGFGRWVQRQGTGSTVIFISERRNEQNAVTATIEMRWTLGVRADGRGSVRLETLTTEKIDLGAVEGPAFGRLDRSFNRVASAR
ncbi:MAG: hypothetical protein SFU83_15725 [Meiothermus sp.]|nr:hypothetical protein [Meiothermus sp.]